jgi:hypothetical protein
MLYTVNFLDECLHDNYRNEKDCECNVFCQLKLKENAIESAKLSIKNHLVRNKYPATIQVQHKCNYNSLTAGSLRTMSCKKILLSAKVFFYQFYLIN